MSIPALESRSRGELVLLLLAVGLSLGVHGVVAGGVTYIEAPEPEGPVWVEMTLAIQEPPPEVEEVVEEPEPEPEVVEEPEPEPEPEPDPIDFEEIPEEPPEEAPEPPPRRIVQGLSSDSFSEGSGTNLSLRAGTTVATEATEATMGLDEAAADRHAPVAYTQVKRAPRIRRKPRLEVPSELVEAELQGRVEVEVTVSPEGTVVDVVVVSSLHPAADAACIAALRDSRWRPGTVDGEPVTVTGVPWSCRFEMVED